MFWKDINVVGSKKRVKRLFPYQKIIKRGFDQTIKGTFITIIITNYETLRIKNDFPAEYFKFTHVTMKENCRVLVNKSKWLKLVTDSRSGQILIYQYRIGFKFTMISYEIITDTGFFRTKINQIKIAINFFRYYPVFGNWISDYGIYFSYDDDFKILSLTRSEGIREFFPVILIF